ncbi:MULTISPECIES: cytochrome c oxidase subunit 3 family protein [Nocardia]|uniref:Cytochrome aa3 subunit 3 n=1 Tax=Nocardia vinacea TaxID=96468 RepID=A0ABZ1YP78_9NOCA|nr:cytochrome c oxidase subunit 3 family protein [Nocardia vinacea]
MTKADPVASELEASSPTEARDIGQKSEAHLPGDVAVWVFVLGDLIIFSSYFIIFMVDRNRDPDLFLQSQQHLDLNIGVVNTLILLASSWCVARSVVAARNGEYQHAMMFTVAGGLCGVLFVLIKIYEWSSKISQGMTLPSNHFFMYYYMLTGVHLFHVLLGLVILAVVLAELRNPRLRRMKMVEIGATYWHMVDLLWIVVFALVYVVR